MPARMEPKRATLAGRHFNQKHLNHQFTTSRRGCDSGWMMDSTTMDVVGTAPLQSPRSVVEPPEFTIPMSPSNTAWTLYTGSKSESSAVPSAMSLRFAAFTSFASSLTLKRTRSSRSIVQQQQGSYPPDAETSTSPSSSESSSSSPVVAVATPVKKSLPRASCLKNNTGNSNGISLHKKARTIHRVRFAEDDDDLVASIHEVECDPDSWLYADEVWEFRQKDAECVECDITAQQYLRTTDAAFLEVVNPNSLPGSTNPYKQRMVQGVHEGHRALEYFSRDGKHRTKSRRLAVISVVAKSRLLKKASSSSTSTPRKNTLTLGTLLLHAATSPMVFSTSLEATNSPAHQLRKHALKLSRRSEQWALFLGQVDALAAVAEYQTIPPALLLHRTCCEVVPSPRRRFFFLAQ
jgi:hypothetical protein